MIYGKCSGCQIKRNYTQLRQYFINFSDIVFGITQVWYWSRSCWRRGMIYGKCSGSRRHLVPSKRKSSATDQSSQTYRRQYLKVSAHLGWNRWFTVERIHNTKEQIYFYERAENHKAKERMFKSFKRANFPGRHSDAGGGWMIPRKWVHKYKDVGVRFADFFLIYLKYPMKMK